jgi:hypothetical protein
MIKKAWWNLRGDRQREYPVPVTTTILKINL